MKASVIALLGVAGLAAAANAQVVNYSVETHAVNSFARDADNGTEVTFYDGTGSWDLGGQETVLNPGQSLVLRVSMSMPGHNQTFAGSGSRLLKGFGTATFNLNLANALGGATTGGAAPLNPTLYPLGVTSDWEDLVENFDDGTPNQAIFGPDSITSIVPAQVPGFSSPLNTEATPWVVDLIWTPSDYSARTVTWSLSDATDVLVWAGNLNNGNDWVEFVASIAGISGEVQIVPAPASLALLGLGGLVAGRRRR